MVDPFSAAIEAAVQRAVAAEVPKIIEAITGAQKPAQAPAEPDRLLRLDEAARLLGVHRTTLFRLKRAGELPPPRKVGSAAGYLMSDLRAYLDRRAA